MAPQGLVMMILLADSWAYDYPGQLLAKGALREELEVDVDFKITRHLALPYLSVGMALVQDNDRRCNPASVIISSLRLGPLITYETGIDESGVEG